MFPAALVTSNMYSEMNSPNPSFVSATSRAIQNLKKLNLSAQHATKDKHLGEFDSPLTAQQKSSRMFFPTSIEHKSGQKLNESDATIRRKRTDLDNSKIKGKSKTLFFENSPDIHGRHKSRFRQNTRSERKFGRMGTIRGPHDNNTISLNTFTELQTEEPDFLHSPTIGGNPISPLSQSDAVRDYEEKTERGCFNPEISDRALLYTDHSQRCRNQESSKHLNSGSSRYHTEGVLDLPTRGKTLEENIIIYNNTTRTNKSQADKPMNRQATLKSMLGTNRSNRSSRSNRSLRSKIDEKEEDSLNHSNLLLDDVDEKTIEQSIYSHKMDNTVEEKHILLKEKEDNLTESQTISGPTMNPIVKRWQKAIRKVILCNKFSSLNKEIHSEKVSTEENQPIPRFLILPESKFQVFWSIIMLLALTFTAIYLPIRMSFIEDLPFEFLVIEYILDMIFFIDIFVNFTTAYYDFEHKLITDRKKIAKKYLKSWFIIDALALFPFWIFEGDSDGTAKNVNRLLRLLRLSRLYRILRFLPIFDILQRNKSIEKMLIAMKMNSGIKRLLKSVLVFFLFCHLFACFWFYTARFANFNPETWVMRYGYKDHAVDHQYLISFSWVVTLSTIGYGDLFPYTKTERVVSMIYIIAGVTFVSYSIGTLSSILLSSDSKAQNLKKRMLVLDELALTLHMDSNFYYKLKQIIRNNHETHFYSDMNYDSLLEELPSALRSQLITLIYNENKLDVITFFQNQHPNFLNSILPLLKRISVEKDEVIFNDGDMADEMYFILEGKIRFVSPDNYVFRIMSKGTYFGEQEMLKKEDFRTESAIAAVDCKLLVLKRNELLTLMENYQDIQQQLRIESKERENQNKEFLIQARFANTKLENKMQYRINASRQQNLYNRAYTKSSTKVLEPPSSPDSALSSIMETIQDSSEDESNQENTLEEKDINQKLQTGENKVEWEEDSEDLECSDTYTKTSGREKSTPPRKRSSTSSKPLPKSRTRSTIKSDISEKSSKPRDSREHIPNIVETGYFPPIKGVKKLKPLIPKLNLQEKANSNCTEIKMVNVKGESRPTRKKRSSTHLIHKKKKNSLIDENNIIIRNRRSSLPVNQNVSAGILQNKLLSIHDTPQKLKVHHLQKPPHKESKTLGLDMIIELKNEIHSLKENIHGFKIQVSPPPPPQSTERKSGGKRRSSKTGTDVFNFGKRTSILHSMEWQKELFKKNKF